MNYLLDKLLRFRHRRGHGIQSPWTYEFVRDAISEHLPYYCFDRMRGLRASLRKITDDGMLGEQQDEQLFRIAQWIRPSSIIQVGVGSGLSLCYLQHLGAMCPVVGITAEISPTAASLQQHSQIKVCEGNELQLLQTTLGNSPAGLVHLAFTHEASAIYSWIMDGHTADGTIIVIEHLKNHNRHLWQRIVHDKRAILTFDLGTRGLVVINNKRIKEHYIL